MPQEGASWEQARMKVLDALETLAEGQSDLGKQVHATNERVAAIRAQAVMAGAIAGLLVGAMLAWLVRAHG